MIIFCSCFEARITIWMDYYSELLKHVIIVNPPTFLTAVWKVASAMLPTRIHNRFTFARRFPDDLLGHLSIDVIPTAYAGNYKAGGDLQNGCVRSRPIVDSDMLENGAIWHQHHITSPPTPEHFVIRANDQLQLRYSVDADQSFIYEFQVLLFRMIETEVLFLGER